MKKSLRVLFYALLFLMPASVMAQQAAVPLHASTNFSSANSNYSFTEAFDDIAHWTSTLGSATGTGCNFWSGVAVTPGTSIGDGVKTTTTTTGTIGAITGNGSGVERGTTD